MTADHLSTFLTALDDAAAKATPGPRKYWEHRHIQITSTGPYTDMFGVAGGDGREMTLFGITEPHATLIALSDPAVIRALVAVARAAQDYHDNRRPPRCKGCAKNMCFEAACTCECHDMTLRAVRALASLTKIAQERQG